MSEYGGNEGILQPGPGDPRLPEAAARAGLGHEMDAGELARSVRRAGLKEANGIPATRVPSPVPSAPDITTPYDEARATEDYISGNND